VCGLPEEVSDERRFYLNPNYSTKPHYGDLSVSNTQYKLSKARPPRVQITYDVEVGGAESKKELPLVMGVIGNFAKDDLPLRDRRFTHIDKDNFNNVMEGMKSAVDMLGLC
jgi:type VI secretion system protein ImpB